MVDGFLVNQSDLAKIAGKTARQILNLEGAGLPVAERGKRKGTYYDLRLVVPWLVEHEKAKVRPDDKREAETRKAVALARTAELDLEEREGRLISLDVYGQVVGDVFERVAARLRNLPGSVAPRLVNRTRPRDVVAVLGPVIRDCMESMRELAAALRIESGEGDAVALGDDFPGVRQLRRAGLHTEDAVVGRLDDIEAVAGIGPKRAAEIRERCGP